VSELESEEEPSELEFESDELRLTLVLSFLGLGASSSELESDPVEDSLLDAAFLFKPLTFGFGDRTFTGTSSSSSASLSELLDEPEDETEAGASPISISLPSLPSSLLLSLPLLLASTFCSDDFCSFAELIFAAPISAPKVLF